MNCIVAGIGNHGAKCQAQREEDLCRCIEPYKWVQKTFPLLMTNLKQTSAFRELLNLLFERHVSSGLEAQRALPSRYSYSYDAGADLDSLAPQLINTMPGDSSQTSGDTEIKLSKLCALHVRTDYLRA